MGNDEGRKQAEKWLAKKQKQWARERKIAEFKRLLGDKPRQYKHISVPDWNRRTQMLTSFRRAYADFFRTGYYQENSALQSHSTQLFWHRLYLQKKRMERLGITMEMESDRVERSKIPQESVLEDERFDGRYEVSCVNEAIYSKRSFIKDGREIGVFHDHESVNYDILSAKQKGNGQIVCPNCGNMTTRENLIDGCDYCGTKFTIEDLEDRVNGFNFQFEVAKKELSELGRQSEDYFDERAGAMVRQYDPNYSFRSFRANIYNMMAAIHFADSLQQINAFSKIDLTPFMDQYTNVVNIDFESLFLWDSSALVRDGFREKNDYYVEDGIQHIKCAVLMVIFALVDGKIQMRNETIKLNLEKSADCLTQNICEPSVFRCKGCGSSLSLMDGKACPYCGAELDMVQYDWVITGFEANLSEYGNSRRTYN